MHNFFATRLDLHTMRGSQAQRGVLIGSTGTQRADSLQVAALHAPETGRHSDLSSHSHRRGLGSAVEGPGTHWPTGRAPRTMALGRSLPRCQPARPAVPAEPLPRDPASRLGGAESAVFQVSKADRRTATATAPGEEARANT
jgi:hypothetical protein